MYGQRMDSRYGATVPAPETACRHRYQILASERRRDLAKLGSKWPDAGQHVRIATLR